MSDFYWILPKGAVNFKGEKLDSKFVVIKASSRQKAEEAARRWRNDNQYEIYTAAQKVPFARFAFERKFEACSIEDASNTLREYKYQTVNLYQMDDEPEEGSITCLPEDLIKTAANVIGSRSEPIPEYTFGTDQVIKPPFGFYLIVNKSKGLAIMVENKAKIYCSNPKEALSDGGELEGLPEPEPFQHYDGCPAKNNPDSPICTCKTRFG